MSETVNVTQPPQVPQQLQVRPDQLRPAATFLPPPPVETPAVAAAPAPAPPSPPLMRFRDADGTIRTGVPIGLASQDNQGVIRTTPHVVQQRVINQPTQNKAGCGGCGGKAAQPATRRVQPDPQPQQTAPTPTVTQAPTIVQPPSVVIDENVGILWHTVGYGQLKFGSTTGWGSDVKPPPELEGWSFISAHAPAAILLRNTKPIKLAAFFNGGSNPKVPVTFYASGNYIGQIEAGGQSTLLKYGEFDLWPDEHLLEIVLNGSTNASSHTVWAFKTID